MRPTRRSRPVPPRPRALIRLKSLHLPSLAVGSELFVPTGPMALPPTYSVRGMMTRSFPVGRIHFNGAYGTFNVRTPVGFEKIIPPIHGACSVAPTELAMTVRFAPVDGVQADDVLRLAAQERSTPVRHRAAGPAGRRR